MLAIVAVTPGGAADVLRTSVSGATGPRPTHSESGRQIGFVRVSVLRCAGTGM
jgi:hypothetical protein